MKKLSKKQIILIVLMSIATILTLSLSIYIIVSFFTQSLPIIQDHIQFPKNMWQEYHVSELLFKAIFYPIIYIITLWFLYGISLWLSLWYNRHNQTSLPH